MAARVWAAQQPPRFMWRLSRQANLCPGEPVELALFDVRLHFRVPAPGLSQLQIKRRQVVSRPYTQAKTVSRTSYGTVTRRTERSRWEPETFATVEHR